MFDQTRYRPIEKPHVSVIIPVYNEENCIKDCITSLSNQDFKPIEILTVDDGSKDSSAKICEDLNLKVLKQNHKGPGAARNLGARNAKGNILILIDADMVLASDYVSKMIEPIIRGETIATCHWNELVSNWENVWARCQTYDLGLPEKRRQPLDPPPENEEQVYRAVRKDFFLDSGGHSEKKGWGEDTAIFKRTKVPAKIIISAQCYHRNLENAKELLIHSAWRGKNAAVESDKRFWATSASLFYNNPLTKLVKGFNIGIKKKEPYMVLYELIYSIGFSAGAIYSLFTKKHLK